MNQIRETNSLAVVSLVAGILGWTLMPLIGSLSAIITGHMARAEIRRDPQRFEGDGLAVGGLVLGWSAVVLAVIALLTMLAFLLFFGGLAWFASTHA
ncbi:DUF4190 domain-containing protein [Xanthomonas albilineans]|uniref:Putative membrane protein n=1 Tax=Xanthomonas albilineans (strain GPE PC73 / CFBP 7063) TaxID=380358 RepID=D2UA01_XANAP|nr:DUF4190 domain-containing protein [Xanthomonas albilineans]QHQ27951.1 putative membrane protein [Xanthomonas albilineans]CBA15730.1 putative membrane protein [Xanthomonas albilineans GPE PC73]